MSMDLKTVDLSSGAAELSPRELVSLRQTATRRSTDHTVADPVQQRSGPETRTEASEKGSPASAEPSASTNTERDVDNPILDEFLKNPRFKLSFRVDEATNEVVVSVIDPETKDVIRQIPPEELLRQS